ncbi:MAG: UDP-N-acetylmuramoyl-tripeptide--D-alanyl-D-alanine ligase [Erysipelotrichaceae bacterium]|nr:UDP-N-acetylmuramoyl-tripeptide--D-alanyl-D-alanine ligase [Erysipelotrichaceae bacterium]
MINDKTAEILIILLYLVVYLTLSFVYGKHALQVFQQNHYELRRYGKWLTDKKNLHFSVSFIYIVAVLCVNTLFKNYGPLFCIFLSIAFAVYLLMKENKKVYIKDLVITARVKRQIAVMIILEAALILIGMRYLPADVLGICAIFLPYLLIYPMALLSEPVEYLIKKYYENDARKILQGHSRLIKVGITGSYGKTSTKNIVTDIISDRFFTLMTPASYNTPMGITRTVREMLKPIHEVFICEMGADKAGDITYLMDFVKPKYGIVTSIGPQHLNTFNSLENIIHEKMQEIEMLPEDGIGFINVDNEYIKGYQIKNTCRIVTVGIENKDADYLAKNIRFSKNGSEFTVEIDKKKYKFTTSLLGKHNITNILLGIALAAELGIDMKQIQKKVASVRQIEHRLQLKKINGYTFIDDAFNSNPVGSGMALDVLSMMDGKRVIVTPGMIDLGEKQDELNREFGAYMKDRADHVVLVGEKQTRPILEGLKQSGFNEAGITVCRNINEAFDFVYRNFTVKDTILLENDLPDAFSV